MRVIYERPDPADQEAIRELAATYRTEVKTEGSSITLFEPSEALLEEVAALKISGAPFDSNIDPLFRNPPYKGPQLPSPGQVLDQWAKEGFHPTHVWLSDKDGNPL